MVENLAFSKFNNQEFYVISELLCDIFVTTKPELELLYKEIIEDFSKDGWPSHFVRRSFFKSEHQDFQKIYEISPSVAIDLPSLFELDNGINEALIIVSATQAERPPSSARCNLYGTGL